MAGMNANIPADGTPIMGNMQRPMQPGQQMKDMNNDPRFELNTYIYDYFLRNKHYALARMLLESDLKPSVKRDGKPSPGNRNVNGMDAMEDNKDDLPPARLPDHVVAENSFLMDWWCLFWDVWSTARKRGDQNSRSFQYMAHTRVRQTPLPPKFSFVGPTTSLSLSLYIADGSTPRPLPKCRTSSATTA